MGWVLGVPSTVALLFLTWAWISMRNTPAPDARFTSVQKYGIVSLLESGAYGLGKVFQFFGDFSSWVAGILAILACVVIVLSALLFCTGRGLQHHATWARIVGGLLSLGLLFASPGLLLGLPRGASAGSLVFFCAAGYAIWVLGWRFS